MDTQEDGFLKQREKEAFMMGTRFYLGFLKECPNPKPYTCFIGLFRVYRGLKRYNARAEYKGLGPRIYLLRVPASDLE